MAKVKILIGNVKGPKGDGAVIDPTLSIEGQVADAAAVGEKFVDLSDDISTVTSIAKGKNQALAYESYAEMIAALNAMDDTELNRGQNIYIATVGVPDLWIYSVKDSSVAYTYSDDNAFVTELKENATVQIGYYRVAQLETQKVDLSAYYTGSKVDALLQSKQNNLGFTPAKASDLNNYLSKSGGTMTGNINTSSGAIYPVDGNVYVNSPGNGCVGYLSNLLAGKLNTSGGHIYGAIEMNGNVLGGVGDIWMSDIGFIKAKLNSYATFDYVNNLNRDLEQSVSDEIGTLEQRVHELERRVSELERGL